MLVDIYQKKMEPPEVSPKTNGALILLEAGN